MRNNQGGSVIYAIIVAFMSLFLTSILWYVFYPAVYQMGESITLYGGSGSYFGELIQNTWTWVGVIMLCDILLWVFAYTVKPDWESRVG